MNEIIEWNSVQNELPIDNRNVHLFRIGQVAIGFYDHENETWRLADSGTAIEFVDYWAYFPNGPTEVAE